MIDFDSLVTTVADAAASDPQPHPHPTRDGDGGLDFRFRRDFDDVGDFEFFRRRLRFALSRRQIQAGRDFDVAADHFRNTRADFHLRAQLGRSG